MTLYEAFVVYLTFGIVIAATLDDGRRRILRKQTRNHPAELTIVFAFVLALWPVIILSDMSEGA